MVDKHWSVAKRVLPESSEAGDALELRKYELELQMRENLRLKELEIQKEMKNKELGMQNKVRTEK